MGSFGIVSERVVLDRRHHVTILLRQPITSRAPKHVTAVRRVEDVRKARYSSAADTAVRIQRGGGTWPCEAPATIGLASNGANSIGLHLKPGRCDEALQRPPSQDKRRRPREARSRCLYRA